MLLLRPTQGGCLRLLVICAAVLLTMGSPSYGGPPRGSFGAGDNDDETVRDGKPPASEGSMLLAELRPHKKKRVKSGEPEDPNDYLHVNAPGSSSHSHRKAAVSEIPFDKLPAEKQLEVRHLLKNFSYYRRLPTLTMEVDHRTYLFLIGNPDVTVSIWRAMKISKVELWETEKDHYESNTGDGTTGTVEVLHRSNEKHLVLCDGEYKSPLMARPIAAKSMVLLTSSYSRDAEGKQYVTHRGDLFVQFPSQTMDTAARIFSPLTVNMTDRSFSEVSVFLRIMSDTMAKRPDVLGAIARKLDGVSEERRDQLVTLAARVHADAQKLSLGEINRQNAGGRSAVGGDGNAVPRLSTQEQADRRR